MFLYIGVAGSDSRMVIRIRADYLGFAMTSKADDSAGSASGDPTVSILPPVQARSRRSWDRVLDATRELLVTRGDAGFTISDVSALAGVSIGSIYGRVQSKASLLSAVHERELERIDRSIAAGLQHASAHAGPFDATVRALIGSLVDVLTDEAPLLRALIHIAADYPAVATRGRAAGVAVQRAFVDGLTDVCIRFGIRSSPDDIAWLDEVVYGVATRQLRIGLANRGESMQRIDQRELIDRLAGTVTAYLRARQPESVGPNRDSADVH